jgi:hypothetical protein
MNNNFKFHKFKKNYRPNEKRSLNAPEVKDTQNYVMEDFCGTKTPFVNSDIIRSDIYNLMKNVSVVKYKDMLSVDTQVTNFKFSTDGIHCLLFFTVYQNRMRSYIIHNNKIICTRFRVTPEIYKGSLFDGELVYTRRGRWVFLVNETIMIENKLTSYNLESDLLGNRYKSDFVLEIAEIRFNKLYPINQLKTLTTQELVEMDYQVRGLYLYKLTTTSDNYTKIDDRYYLTIQNPNKEESQEPEQDIDSEKVMRYKLMDTFLPDVFQLLDGENKVGIAFIPNLDMSQKINEELKKKEILTVDCKYSKKFKKWYPVSIIQ